MKPTLEFDPKWEDLTALTDKSGNIIYKSKDIPVWQRGHESNQSKEEVERLVHEGLYLVVRHLGTMRKVVAQTPLYAELITLGELFVSKTPCTATILKGIHQFNTTMGFVGAGEGPHITVRANNLTLHVWLTMQKGDQKHGLTRFAYKAVQLSARPGGPFVPPTVTYEVYQRSRSMSMTLVQFNEKFAPPQS